MKFIHDQFDYLQNNLEANKNNYQTGTSWLARKLTFLHTLKYLIFVNKNISKKKEENRPFTVEELKQIKEEDTTIFIAQEMNFHYQQILSEKEENDTLTSADIFRLIFRTFRGEFLLGWIFFIIPAFLQVLFSFLLLFLIEEVHNQQYKNAYILCTVLVIMWFVVYLFNNHGSHLPFMLAPKIKAALSIFLYCKLSTLTSFALRANFSGMIINMIANDLSALDERILYLFFFFPFIIFAAGAIFLAVQRIGPLGIAAVGVVFLLIPITHFLSKINGRILENLTKIKDKRIQLSTEVIEGIKYVKIYGWQLTSKNNIDQLREQQLSSLRMMGILRSIERALSRSIGFFSSLAIFVIAYNLSINFNAAFIFTILVIMSNMKSFAMFSVYCIDLIHELNIIFQRYAAFFNFDLDHDHRGQALRSEKLTKEKNMNKKNNRLEKQRDQRIKGTVVFDNYSAYLEESSQDPFLTRINCSFRSGSLYGMTGKVGSGKSLFLAAILGELPFYSGTLSVEGSIAYVEQEPVLFSDTIKSNILFGRSFNSAEYSRALSMSQLKADLELLPQREKTVVGEKGVTLSGGQKARLSLARAIYADADIYILDDPLSAVDSKVAKKIFWQCIRPLSQIKTVILVSHQLHYIEECDQILILEEGKINAKGTPQQLKVQMEKLNEQFKTQDQEEEQAEQDIFQMSSLSASNITSAKPSKIVPDTLTTRFEQKQTQVNARTYCRFFFNNKVNFFLAPLTILLFILSQLILAFFFRLLADHDNVVEGRSTLFNGTLNSYWLFLTLVMLGYTVALALQYFLVNICIVNSSSKAHERMIATLVRSPCSFFDSTPSGIIINRLSNDLGTIDNNLFYALTDSLQGVFGAIIALANIIQINFSSFFPSMVIMIVAIWFFWYCRPAYIVCKQLFLQSKNKIIHFLGQSINGLTHIRIFKQRINRMQEFTETLNKTTKSAIAFEMMMRGFGFNQTIIICVLVAVGMFMGIANTTPENSGLFGVTIVYLTNLSAVFQWTLKQIIATEGLMVSAQRIQDMQVNQSQNDLRTPYDCEIGLDAEVLANDRGEHCHEDWPASSTISLRNFSARYREGLPLVLKDLSFTAARGEKVGIVGRTGAGKSSIIQALFRIFEPEVGSVYNIGGHDALKMGLHSLRQHISVIPQVPFLFRGTVRENIDPFGTASEERVWEVLEQANLAGHIRGMGEGLSTELSNSTEVFSVGQKQLLCLARALIQRNKFLVLDQATSNVDMKTDALIQRVIREKFVNTTVITIAHRINTIADYDRVVVLRQGEVAEEGAPWKLIERKGLFYDMVRHTGKNAEDIKKKARLHFAHSR